MHIFFPEQFFKIEIIIIGRAFYDGVSIDKHPALRTEVIKGIRDRVELFYLPGFFIPQPVIAEEFSFLSKVDINIDFIG